MPNTRQFRCYRSAQHLIADYPHPPHNEVEEAMATIHISLFNSKLASNERTLQVEALSKGVLDSGCSKTVAGVVWFSEFLHTLSDEERKCIKEQPSKSLFRFGDGVKARSLKCVTITVTIGRSKFQMDVEIVNNEIPLLIRCNEADENEVGF